MTVQPLNMIKLCVGATSVEDLLDWFRTHPSPFETGERRHVTRMWPRAEARILAGGSLYWVIRGEILCRQRIVRLDELIGDDGRRRCGIIMDPEVIRTSAAPRRPFQGWRYLEPKDAPPDLGSVRVGDDTLPPGMAKALAEWGVL
jgi:hypothetical protein